MEKRKNRFKIYASTLVFLFVAVMGSLAYLNRMTDPVKNNFEAADVPLSDKYILHYDINEAHGGVSGAPSDDEETIPPANEAFHNFNVKNAPNIQGQEGKVFMGWSEDPDAQIPTYGYNGAGKTAEVGSLLGTVYDTDSLEKQVKVTKEEGRRKTVYAIWANYYEVSFDPNAKYGGQGNVPATQRALTINKWYSFKIPAQDGANNVPNKENLSEYEFEKWGLSEDRPINKEDEETKNFWLYGNDIVLYEDGTMKSVEEPGNEKLGRIVKLWARYRTDQTFKLFYFENNLPSGVKVTNMPSPNPVIGDGTLHYWNLTISNSEPQAEGYIFSGWSENPDALEGEYQPGQSYLINKDVSHTSKLYAIWTKKEVSVTYHVDLKDGTLKKFNTPTYAFFVTEENGNTTNINSKITEEMSDDKSWCKRAVSNNLPDKFVSATITELGWQKFPVNVAGINEYEEIIYRYSNHNNNSYYYDDAYEFVGWSFSPNATEPDITSGKGLSIELTAADGFNLDLYAVLKPRHMFGIEFDLNYPRSVKDPSSGAFSHDAYLDIIPDTIYANIDQRSGGKNTETVLLGSFSQSTQNVNEGVWLEEYKDDSRMVKEVLRASAAPRTRDVDMVFLGWSENPNATEPDPKYELDEKYQFIHPIEVSVGDDTCNGGFDENNELDIHYGKKLYAVWGYEKKHRFSYVVDLNKRDAALNPDEYKPISACYLDQSCKNSLNRTSTERESIYEFISEPVDYEESYMIPAGTDVGFSSRDNHSAFELLGFSEDPNATEPDEKWRVEWQEPSSVYAGYYYWANDIVFEEMDPDCSGEFNTNTELVPIHRQAVLYPVIQRKHNIYLYYQGMNGIFTMINDSTIYSGTNLVYTGEYSKKEVPANDKNITFEAGSIQLRPSAGEEFTNFEEEFFKITGKRILGWTTEKGSNEVDHRFDIGSDGKLLNDFTYEIDNCRGNELFYTTEDHKLYVYPVLGEDSGHNFKIIFNRKNNKAVVESGYVDNTIESYTFEEELSDVINDRAYIRDKGWFVGWSEDKDATEPDPKYALDENGYLLNPITITHDVDECLEERTKKGPTTHTLKLYPVYKHSQHTYSIRIMDTNTSGIKMSLPGAKPLESVKHHNQLIDLDGNYLGNGNTYEDAGVSGRIVPWYSINTKNALCYVDLNYQFLGTLAEDTVSFSEFEFHQYDGYYKVLGYSLNPDASTIDLPIDNRGYVTIDDLDEYFDSLDHSECSHVTNESDMIIHELKLYPVYEEQITLSYNLNGGRSSPTIDADVYRDPMPAESGVHTFDIYDAKGENNIPTKGNYVFMGWSTTKSGNAEFGHPLGDVNGTKEDKAMYRLTSDVQTQITIGRNAPVYNKNNRTLYAVWFNQYRINYHLNAEFASWGEGVYDIWLTSQSRLNTNITQAIPTYINPATGEEWEFLGWSTNPKARTPEYTQGSEIEMRATNGKAEKDLYAVWKAPYEERKITYDLNGGELPTSIDQVEVVASQSDSYTFDIYDGELPTKEGMHFIGWATTKNGNAVYGYDQGGALTEFTSGLQTTITATEQNPEITLYAVYVYEYQMVYHVPDGTQWSEDTVAYKYFKNKQSRILWRIPTVTPTYTDPETGWQSTFKYWGTEENATWGYYPNGNYYHYPNSYGNVMHFYSIWNTPSKTVTVNYDPGYYGEFVTPIDSESYTLAAGSETEHTFNIYNGEPPVRDGYKFIGWNTGIYASTPKYGYPMSGSYARLTQNVESTITITNLQKEVTLYPIWVKYGGVLTYHLNGDGATWSEETEVDFLSGQMRVPDASPTRDGYVFLGWSTTPKGIVKYAAGDYFDYTNPEHLYAIWTTETQRTLHYDQTNLEIAAPIDAQESTVAGAGDSHTFDIYNGPAPKYKRSSDGMINEHLVFVGWTTRTYYGSDTWGLDPEYGYPIGGVFAEYTANLQSTITVSDSQPVTLYPVFKYDYHIQYHTGNGATWSGNENEHYISDDTSYEVVLPTEVPTRTDPATGTVYEFVGWSRTPGGSILGNSFYADYRGTNHVYAVWKAAAQRSISYYQDEAYLETPIDMQEALVAGADDSYTFTIYNGPAPKYKDPREGTIDESKVFVGWTTDNSAWPPVPEYGYEQSGELYEFTKDLKTTITVSTSETVKLYPVYVNRIQVHYDLFGEGATWSRSNDDYFYSYQDYVQLTFPTEVPTRIDPNTGIEYEFKGWSYSNVEGKQNVIDYEVWVERYSVNTFYAVWEPISGSNSNNNAPLSVTEDTQEDKIEVPVIPKVDQKIEEPVVTQQPVNQEPIVEQPPVVQEPPVAIEPPVIESSEGGDEE